jgi:hypothetical protein
VLQVEAVTCDQTARRCSSQICTEFWLQPFGPPSKNLPMCAAIALLGWTRRRRAKAGEAQAGKNSMEYSFMKLALHN